MNQFNKKGEFCKKTSGHMSTVERTAISITFFLFMGCRKEEKKEFVWSVFPF